MQRRLNNGDLSKPKEATPAVAAPKPKPAAVEKKPAAKPVAKSPVEPTPKPIEVQTDDIEIMDEPVTCIVTRNQGLFQKRCEALGLDISDSTWEKLKGSKHEISKFKPGQACVMVNGVETWIPDKGVLVKRRVRKIQSKPEVSPTKELKFQVERKKPVPAVQKRAPEVKKALNATSSDLDKTVFGNLDKTVNSLRNEVALLEKQKDLYRTDLEKERIRRKNLEQMKAQPVPSSGFELVTEAEFSNMVKSYPRGPKKMMLVPTTGSFGLSEVHLYVWLQSEEKPTISIAQSGVDMQMAKDLACTIAFKKLSVSTPFRTHFRQTSI